MVMPQPAAESVDVLVAGGGPVGLALAIELGRWGVSCLLVEPRSRKALQPRAKLVNVRTMELLRRWGIADRAREAASLPSDYSTRTMFVTSLVGHELAVFDGALHTAPVRDERFAEPAHQIPQYLFEPVLAAAAVECDEVEIRLGWRLESFVADAESVHATIKAENGDRRDIEVRYLAGCDGAGSTVRQTLGIPLSGDAAIGRNLGVIFRSAELHRINRFEASLHYWIVNPEAPAFMGPLNRHDLWWYQATGVPAEVDLDTMDATATIWRSIGRQFELEIISRDPWIASRLLADRMREGRVFLLGDAAHQNPPMGGHGMNMGVGDAVDLGWKLGAVCAGWGSPALLDSYEIERRPFHERVLDAAAHNYSVLANDFVREGLDGDTPDGAALRAALGAEIVTKKAKEFYSLPLILGHAYRDSTLVIGDDGPSPPADDLVFESVARVGARAPHAWLADGSSLFDKLGWGVTLLTFDEHADIEAVSATADREGIPLRVVVLSSLEVARLYGAEAALVRPDGHLAWRGQLDDPECVEALLGVAGRRSPTRDKAGR